MKIPNHIAIIMDGNGRWAQQRGLHRTAGHREGIERVKETVREAKALGVKVLTIFAFSTENWNRPKQELELLFSYLNKFLDTYKKELMEENVRLRIIGRRDRFDKKIVKKIEAVESLTRGNDSFSFNIALDYGGRWDIVQAAGKLAGDCQAGKRKPEEITEETFGEHLSLSDIPDPDFLIRTSGEQRISNFLLWNAAYTEFYFPQIHWPDFNKAELVKAIEEFNQRERRFGSA